MIKLRDKLENILREGPDILRQFVTDIRSGFMDQLPNPVQKPHIASTAQCLRVIFEHKHFMGLCNSISPDEVREFLESNEWESSGLRQHNMYVSPQVLMVTSKLGINRREKKVNDAIEYIISCLKRLLDEGRREIEYVDCGHGFILYWAINSLMKYEDQLNETERKIAERAVSLYVENGLFMHLALYLAGDESDFDSVQLAYYLLSSVKFQNYANSKVIDKAIEVIFSKQQEDGTWKLSRPFLHRPEGGVMNCFSIEVPSVILRLPQFESLLSCYLPKLQKTLDWVEKNFKIKESYKGWRSDSHWQAESPESWATALVYDFLSELLKIVTTVTNRTLLASLGGKMVTPKVPWAGIVDYCGFKKSLEKSVIAPIKRNPEGINLEVSSILLFGPPGVGKDTIISALASEVGWPLILIPPPVLLIEGDAKIVKVAETLFNKLLLLKKAVVFFDEFEEFVTSRDIEDNKSGRFITNSMLYWFGMLKEKAQIVSIVATNHLEKIEGAITRLGRFDLILPIGPPEELDERVKLLKKQISALSETEMKHIASFMDRRMTIKEILKFCQFLEEQMKSGDKEKEDLVRIAEDKIKDMNKHLAISVERMAAFEKNFELARY